MDGKTVSKAYVASILSNTLHTYWAIEHRTFAGFSDDEYYLPSPEEIETFLNENPVTAPEGGPRRRI